MTAVFSSLVVLAVLGADSDRAGLPLGIPPGPEDPAIARVAPQKCLFYVNWNGTAAPDPKSRNEMEQLLAEPEVQAFFSAICHWIRSTAGHGAEQPAGSQTSAAEKTRLAKQQQEKAELAGAAVDLLEVWLTHPTAFFIADIRPPAGKPAEAKPPAAKTAGPKPPPQDDLPWSLADDLPWFLAKVDGQAGLIVALGSDAPRVRASVEKLVKVDNGARIERFQLGSQTWYRKKAPKGQKELLAQFGFEGSYFVAAIGDGSLEGILARLKNKEPPAWYAAALKQVPVPRRTGIIYLNVSDLREVLFRSIKSQADGEAALRQARRVFEVLGLDRATSLVSTTGLDDTGMVNKVLLALDGKPQGLLQLVAERPLQPADLAPIPRDATLALALRLDLQKALDLILSAMEKTSPAARAEAAESMARFEHLLGINLHRFLGALGDTWCIYNSPGEGGLVLTGLTAVVPIRDAGLLRIGYAKLLGLAKQQLSSDRNALSEAGVGRMQQFRFGRHEVYYFNFIYFSPAWCVTERQVILALNAHNIKAYLARRDHQPLGVVPEVAQALGTAEGPAMLLYCDTPKVFELAYPVVSMFAQMVPAGLGPMQGDTGLEFWPSAPPIRRHLRPDVSIVQRTPQGIQVTCRYCLPTGGVTGPFFLFAPMTGWSFMPLYSGDLVPPPGPGNPPSTSGYGTPSPPGVAPTPLPRPVEPSQPAKPAPPTAKPKAIRTSGYGSPHDGA